MRSFVFGLICLVLTVTSVRCQRPCISGGVYIRWGNDECPSGDTPVYKGFTATKKYDEGGAANYLCLPEEDVVPFTDFSTTTYGTIYPAKYNLPKYYPHGRHPSDNRLPPCVLCLSKIGCNPIQIGGTDNCPPGMQKEYKGILMSEFKTHTSSQYLCIDGSLSSSPGSGSCDASAFLNVVKAQTGCLKSPLFLNKELSCVICNA